ncbi:hypothetical protein VTN96DRAFT_3526 [Rasamsonia emersonii]
MEAKCSCPAAAPYVTSQHEQRRWQGGITGAELPETGVLQPQKTCINVRATHSDDDDIHDLTSSANSIPSPFCLCVPSAQSLLQWVPTRW